MTFKMKGPSLYKKLKVNRNGYKNMPDGRSTSSPFQQNEDDPKKRHFLEKEQRGPFEGDKKQLPRQPEENPDLAITGGSQHEVVADLEDRIEFVTSDLEEDPTNERLKTTINKLKERLKRERANLKSSRK